MKCYKLTNQDQETINNTKWNIDEWNVIKNVDASQELCTEYWLHAYQSKYIAILMNCRHARINKPRLFEAEAEGEFKHDGQCKFGCTRLRIVKEIKLPRITIEQRIKIGIYCALEVCKDETFVMWANDWLNDKNRSAESAKKVYRSASNNTVCWAVKAAYYAAQHDSAKNNYIYNYIATTISIFINYNLELDVISIINKVLKE